MSRSKSLFFLTLLASVMGISQSTPASPTIIELTIDGTIHQGTVTILEAAFERAKETQAEAILIRLDTPGGLLDSTRDIVKLFLNTDIPVLVYVSPSGAHAGSAGTFITMAAHIAAMAPGTNIGAAHPISATGSDPEKSGGKHLAQKVENDTSAFIETIARQRNRNMEWAKKAVLESAAISEVDAVKLNVIDFVAKDKEEVLLKAHGRKIGMPKGTVSLATSGATLVPLEIDFYTRLKNFLANPTVMFVLILIAGMGLYIEMSHPGLIMPAVASALAVILLLVATSVLPLSVIGVGLVILGFVLLLMELYVTSFGLLAIGGVISFVIGAILLFDPSESDLRVPRGIIVGASLGMSTIALLIGLAMRGTSDAPQLAGAEGLIGVKGVVDQTIVPGRDGRIYVNGEYWLATADEKLDAGTSIEVARTKGLVAHVTKLGG